MFYQGLGPRIVEEFFVLASCLICVLTGLFLLERRRSWKPIRFHRFTVEEAQPLSAFMYPGGMCSERQQVFLKGPHDDSAHEETHSRTKPSASAWAAIFLTPGAMLPAQGPSFFPLTSAKTHGGPSTQLLGTLSPTLALPPLNSNCCLQGLSTCTSTSPSIRSFTKKPLAHKNQAPERFEEASCMSHSPFEN
jgi:hypothetical protein